MVLKSRSMSGLYKELGEWRDKYHQLGYDRAADKVYELEQDCLFDNFSTVQSIKARFNKIVIA